MLNDWAVDTWMDLDETLRQFFFPARGGVKNIIIKEGMNDIENMESGEEKRNKQIEV